MCRSSTAMLAVNTDSWTPHFKSFQYDSGFPSDILIEYLTQPLIIDCITYNKKYTQKEVLGIWRIHSALVEHNDPYPKDILIISGDR